MAFTDFLPLIGDAFNGIVNTFGGQAVSKSAMRYQAQLQQQMIDRANEYNSPANVMQRYIKAGINPNLVAGQISGGMSDTGKVSSVSRDLGVDIDGGSIQRARLERQMAEQQIKRSQWDTLESMTRSAANMMKNRLFRQTFQTQVDKVKADLDHTLQSIRESSQRTDESAQRTNNLLIEANKLTEEVAQMHLKTGFMEKYGAEEIRAKIHQLQSSGDLNDKQREVADSILKLNDARIEQLKKDADWLASKTHAQDLENQITERMNGLGLQGMKPKDFFTFLKDLVLSLVRGK